MSRKVPQKTGTNTSTFQELSRAYNFRSSARHL
jgi:hypothetical protein